MVVCANRNTTFLFIIIILSPYDVNTCKVGFSKGGTTLPEESKTSDSLEGGIDSGIGAASAFAGAASAKAAASAGGAAMVGAAAGTAAGGPAGTVLGTAAGLAAKLAVSPVVKGTIVLALFLVMVFSSIPSMFFEQPVDIANNTGPQAVY